MMFMNKIFITIAVGICFLLSGATIPVKAQTKTSEEKASEKFASEFYDPLTPQSFAFDKNNKLFVAISSINNSIDLIYYSDDSLTVKKHIVVDKTEGRHNLAMIYRPKGIAIYENHIVYLATNRDSTRFTVLDLQGNPVRTFTFNGSAQAFSYSPSAGELYIAGDNPDVGYDIIVLDVSQGFSKITEKNAKTHFRVTKKAEELFRRDPSGFVLLITSMITVFSALILLYIVFKLLGNYMIRKQNKKARKAAPHAVPDLRKEVENTPGGISGDVYAAIAATIYMYQNELHDEETTIITIENASRKYSPWSSKFYGLKTYFKNK
jgi:Na+-transporting methylmalonyl-CoA/oxaloacetate decarboxylase gamma subunit